MTELQLIAGGRAERQTRDLLSCQRAEATIVVGVIVDSRIYDAVRDVLKVEHFESQSHQILFLTASMLYAAGEGVSLLTVTEELRKSGDLERVGGVSGVGDLVDQTRAVTAKQAETLAAVVVASWCRRRVLASAVALQARATEDADDVAVLLDKHRQELEAVTRELSVDRRDIGSNAAAVRATQIAAAANANDGVGANPTGFRRLDRLTAGMHPELTLLGARPGMGKTSLATSIAINVAERGQCVYLASLETDAGTLGLRMACALAGVSMHKARAGLMNQTEWSRLTPAMARLSATGMYIDDESGLQVSELRARARRAAALSGKPMGLIVIDYVQLMRPPRANMKREEVVAENARALKALAQELACPVLALAQLNRGSEQRGDHRPGLADLRESGELEQCARTVMFLYRKDYYRQPGEVMTQDAELIVAKQNNGPTGSVTMRFEGDCLRFTELDE